MRRISMGTRNELLAAVVARYRGATRAEKGRILTEFAEISGYHRKHAERLLRRQHVVDRSQPRPGRRVYSEAVREALVVLWEAADRICGKRLKPLIPLLVPAMEQHGHLALDENVRIRLLEISAATIDRVLAPVRAAGSGDKRRRTAHSSAVRRSVPIRTYADWNDPAPGYMEADLVAHSGPSASGSFVQTLTLTDVATGWTECAPLLFREQRLLSEVMTALRPALPFPLLGFDTDNDSVFMNETIKGWCEGEQVEFTRSRPYRKNDQAHVEQKNGAIVRRMVGYRRYTGVAAATELGRLYRSVRLYVNFFQPSFKLMEKTRDGGRVTKRYHPPLTPFQRVQAHPAVAPAAKDELAVQFAQLDPVVLLHDIRQAQARLTALADATPPLESEGNPKADVEAFFNGLRHAWKEGEIRPTSRKKPSAPRGRRRPDPLAEVTDDLKAWFDEAPSRTGRELLSRLQVAHPNAYPDALLRTVQRRLKIWRGDMAKALVFAGSGDANPMMTSDPLRNVAAPRARGHQEPSSPESSENEHTQEHFAEATT
ncbi:transposase [Aurantimonas sp. A2-1-M11]|uniref:transposase n=1 Tax=Aurantimonas sp. A2-1-M11 TaxID=3113712 RepID=UPI003FA5CEAB